MCYVLLRYPLPISIKCSLEALNNLSNPNPKDTAAAATTTDEAIWFDYTSAVNYYARYITEAYLPRSFAAHMNWENLQINSFVDVVLWD